VLPSRAMAWRRFLVALFLSLAGILPVAAQAASDGGGPVMSVPTGPIVPYVQPSSMSISQAAVLGVVEGITEFLPVSSTGHLAMAQTLMHLEDTPQAKSASDAYAICIQAGAILAVLIVSFGRIRGMARGLVGRDRDGLRLLGSLALAFVPAAVIGLLFEGTVKQYLFGIWPIAGAWLVGGIFILVVLEGMRRKDGKPLEGLTWQVALIIGLSQVLALWPGVSRSLATISAAMVAGLSVAAAVEFSFLLGLVTLGAATLYEGVKRGPEIVSAFGWVSPLVGFLFAAVAAFLAVRWMLAWLRTRSLAVFGWYRIGAAALALLLALR
jgi:undecaprenyl-diphosphatase